MTPFHPFFERAVHQSKSLLRRLEHLRARQMQCRRHDTLELFGVFEPCPSLGGTEDEVMLPGEDPGYP